MAVAIKTGLPPLPTMKFYIEGQEVLMVSHDLPKPGTFKWTDSKRRMFIMAVKNELITEADLRRLYGMTIELLQSGPPSR